MTEALTYPDHASALYEALRDDPYYAGLEQCAGAAASGRDAMLRYFDYSMSEAERHGELFMPGDHAFGVSVWAKPTDPQTSARRSERKHAFLDNVIGGDSLAFYESVIGFMSTASADLVSDDAWYLSIVGVLPEYQERGLGEELIRPVLAKTDATGVATWLETFTPRNMSFYERLGYRVAGSFEEPTIGEPYWLMLRAPA